MYNKKINNSKIIIRKLWNNGENNSRIIKKYRMIKNNSKMIKWNDSRIIKIIIIVKL